MRKLIQQGTQVMMATEKTALAEDLVTEAVLQP